MESLRTVERDGRKLFCFIEICVIVFPKFAKSTVRSWLKQLNIPSVTCTQEERSFFKSNNGFLNGSFGLIYDSDMKRLVRYRDEKSPDSSLSPKKQSISSASHSPSLILIGDEPLTSQPIDKSPIESPIGNTHSSPTNYKDVVTSETMNTSLNSKSSPPIVTCSETSTGLGNAHQPIKISPIANIDRSLVTSPTTTILEPSQSIPHYSSPPTVTSEGPRSLDNETVFTSPPILPTAPVFACSSDNENMGEGRDTPSKKRKMSVPDVEKDERRQRCKLLPDEIPEGLRQEIESLRKFYTVAINSKRDTVQFSESTISKLIERILCFMFFVKKKKNIPNLCLSIFNSEDIVSDYITHLTEVRKLMPSTVSSILSVAINVVKYNHRDDPTRSQSCPSILGYRRLQRQFSRGARLLSKRAKEGLTAKSSQQFYFAHILEVLRNLHTKQLETQGLVKARFLHDFVLIATYLRAMPGRTSEIRSLKLFIASEQKPFNMYENTTDNFIVFGSDNRVVLIQNNHKTVKTHGPVRLDISDDLDLLKYLRMYLKCRPKLMQGKAHDNFFVNVHGDAFSSSAAVSKYLGDLFEREVSIRVGTNKLRHSIVTYFHSIDQSKDVSVRESLAALMKHSVRYQNTVYNDTTQDEKTRKGRTLMRDALTAGIFGEVSEDLEYAAENSDESLSDSDEIEIRPQVNDICALLDPTSTADNISIFIAKVARYTPDGEEVQLIYLEPVENSENLYKLKPGKVWREATNSLVYPIDIVYNSSENAYHLRTSAIDIYKFVKRK